MLSWTAREYRRVTEAHTKSATVDLPAGTNGYITSWGAHLSGYIP